MGCCVALRLVLALRRLVRLVFTPLVVLAHAQAAQRARIPSPQRALTVMLAPTLSPTLLPARPVMWA
jgi:hypothetical protein